MRREKVKSRRQKAEGKGEHERPKNYWPEISVYAMHFQHFPYLYSPK